MSIINEQKKSMGDLEKNIEVCMKQTLAMIIAEGDRLYYFRTEKALVEEAIKKNLVSSEEKEKLRFKMEEIEEKLNQLCEKYADLSQKYFALCRAKQELFGYK